MGDGLMVEVPRKAIVTDSAVGWKLLEDSPKIHGFLAGELAICNFAGKATPPAAHHRPPIYRSSPLAFVHDDRPPSSADIFSSRLPVCNQTPALLSDNMFASLAFQIVVFFVIFGRLNLKKMTLASNTNIFSLTLTLILEPFRTRYTSICNLCLHLGGSRYFLHGTTMQQYYSSYYIPVHGTYTWKEKVSAAIKYHGPCIANNLSHCCFGSVVDSVRVWIS